MWGKEEGRWPCIPRLDALLHALQAVREYAAQSATRRLRPVLRCSFRSLTIGGLMYLAHPTPLPAAHGAVRNLVVAITATSAFALLCCCRPSTAEPQSDTLELSLHDLSQLQEHIHPDRSCELPRDLKDLEEIRHVHQGSNFEVRLVAFLDSAGVQRLFALKKVGSNGKASDGALARACLARETDILFKCSHDSIVKALCVLNAPDDEHVVLMEWFPYGDLFTLLQREGYLSEKSAIFSAAEVIAALEHLHARRIAHRDLKPENLLVDVGGHLKLTGLSYSKVISERSYSIVGTLPYMAPELILNEGHGLAVDWWAFGVLLYEMTVGEPPFVDLGDELTHYTWSQIISGDVTYPSTMSVHLQDLIGRLLDKMPQYRMGSGPSGAAEILSHPCFSEASNSAACV